MRLMRRLWFPITLLIIVICILLYATGFLFGRVNKEWQHPYSRMVFIEGKDGKFVSRTENAMTKFYYGELGQQLKELRLPDNELKKHLIPSETTFLIKPGRTDPTFPEPKVAPVTFLDPDVEVDFLRTVKSHLLDVGQKDPKANDHANAVCLALIHSLYQIRPIEKSPPPAVLDREKDRVSTIYIWYNTERANPAQPFAQWWRDHAGIFGLKP